MYFLLDIWLYIKYYYLIFSTHPPIIQWTIMMVIPFTGVYLFAITRTAHLFRRKEQGRAQWNKAKERYAQHIDEVLYSSLTMTEEQISDLLELHKGGAAKKEYKPLWTKMILASLSREVYSDLLKQRGASKVAEKPDCVQPENLVRHLNSTNYSSLITLLELPRYWISELQATNSKERRKTALRKVFEMSIYLDPRQSEELFAAVTAPFHYHPTKDIRHFARYMHVAIDMNSPYQFMELGFDDSFNKYDEIMLLAIFMLRSEREELPLFFNFIHEDSTLPFRCFLYRLSAFFRQQESAPQLLKAFVRATYLQEKVVLAEVLAALQYKAAIPAIEQAYEVAPLSEQEVFLMALKELGATPRQETLVPEAP